MSDKIKILDNRDIDLSYNPESENAQSGKAVAEAFAGFTPIDEDQLVGKKTEQGGEIFNDYENNKALAENTSVSGISNQAGYYVFPIASWVGISISNDKKTASIFTNYTAVIDLYAAGDIIQLDIGSHFYNRYKIVKITESHDANGRTDGIYVIIAPTYGETITDDLSLSSDKTDNWFYVVDKGDWTAEFITHSAGASARGKNNIAIGAQSDASGKNNIAIGDLSTVTGRDNKAGYAAHAGGGYSEAMPSYSDTHGYRLKAGRNSQAVRGEWNAEDKDAFFVVGNGTSDTSRSNAFTVGRDGTAKIQSKLIVNDIDIGSKLYESPYVKVNELPERGDMDKIYITPEGQYIYGYKEKDTNENIEIWDGATQIAPKLVNGVYEITNGAELAYIVANGGQEGAYYKLTKDIYLNDTGKIIWDAGEGLNGYIPRKWFQNWGWNPTGGQVIPTATAFKGTIDGNGHIIYGLYVNCKVDTYATSTAYGAALIPKADKNVVIKNLGIEYCYINSQYIASAFVATVNGGGTLSFDNCYIGSNTHFSGNNVGVFVGQPQNSGCSVSITNCYCGIVGWRTSGNYGIYISTWGGITLKNCYSFTSFSTNETTSGVLIQNCYQTLDKQGLKEGIFYVDPENTQGLDALTNPDKMPNLNTIPPKYIATETYPQLIVFTCGWVKIESGIDKEYIDNKIKEETTHISNQLNVKGITTGIGGTPDTAIVLNDISSIPHYVKCKIEYENLAKNLEVKALPEGHELYIGLEGPNGQPNIFYVTVDNLDINKYYYFNVKYKDGQYPHIYFERYSWNGGVGPYFDTNDYIMRPTLDESINTLFISHTELENIESISIIPVDGPTDKPRAYNDIVVSAGNHSFFANEDGVVENIESIYPSMTINADASVNITCEYVKESELADIIGMIIPRYITNHQ